MRTGIPGRVEGADPVDAALSGDRRLPRRTRIEPERGHRSESRDSDAAHAGSTSVSSLAAVARTRRRPPSREPVERPDDLDPSIPVPADGGRARSRAARGRRLAVRAEVGRLPRDPRERVRRAPPLVVETHGRCCATSPSCEPLGEAATAALGARRRDRDRAGRRPRLRRDADASPPRREPRINRLAGEIPAALRRVRRPRLERRGDHGASRSRSGAQGARAEGQALRPLPCHARPRRGARVARPLRGDRARRRRSRSASTLPYLAGLARGRRQGEAREDRRLRRRRPALEVATPTGSRRSCSASTTTTASIDYVGSAAVAPAKHAEIAERVRAAPRRRARAPLLGAEPLGWRRARGVAASGPSSWSRCATTRCSRNRFRHGTKLIRFRDDKEPAQCTWRELLPARPRGVTVASFLGTD